MDRWPWAVHGEVPFPRGAAYELPLTQTCVQLGAAVSPALHLLFGP